MSSIILVISIYKCKQFFILFLLLICRWNKNLIDENIIDGEIVICYPITFTAVVSACDPSQSPNVTTGFDQYGRGLTIPRI